MPKKKIPAAVRNKVWNTYIGNDKKQGNCLCCIDEIISTSNFDCGHVISEKHGGKTTVLNLRPICGHCNSSMGTKNMEEFMKEYEFDKSPNWDGLKKLKEMPIESKTSDTNVVKIDKPNQSNNIFNEQTKCPSQNNYEKMIQDDINKFNKLSQPKNIYNIEKMIQDDINKFGKLDQPKNIYEKMMQDDMYAREELQKQLQRKVECYSIR